jgi:hypothetical protein
MKFLNTQKVLTGLLVSLLGLVGGVAAASYSVGVEKTKITQKVEEHEKALLEINTYLKEISQSIRAIELDVAVLADEHANRTTP